MRAQTLPLTGSSTAIRSLSRFFLAATVISLPFRYRFILLERPFPPIYSDYTDVLLFISDVFLLATLASGALALALERRRLHLGPWFLTAPVAGLTAIAVLSSLSSVDALLSAYHSVRLIILAGFYLYILNEIKSLDFLTLPVLTQTFIQAAVGIVQVLRQHSLGLAFLGELELDPAWQGVSIVWAEGIRSLRAYGLSDHPNILGGCFAFSLILIAGWYIQTKSAWRLLTTSVFSLGALGLLYTYSRSAWLALAAGSLYLLLMLFITRQSSPARSWFNLTLASGILLLPFIWQSLPYIGVRLNYQDSFTEVPQENQSIGERQLLNNLANHTFAEHPLTGVGLAALPLALHERYPALPVNYQPAHNTLLDAAAETGIFGALFYAAAMLTPWMALWLNRDRLVFSPELIVATALLLAVTVVGFFDYYTWLLAPGRLWQWLSWGLWAAVYRNSLREASHA